MAATLIIYDDPWSIIQHCTFLNISIYIYYQAVQFAKESSSLWSLFDVYCVLGAWRPLPAALPTLVSLLIILANSLSKRQNRRAMNIMNSLSFIPPLHMSGSSPCLWPTKKPQSEGKRANMNKPERKTLRKKSLICRWSPITPSRNTRISHGSRL